MRKIRNAYKILAIKLEGKRQFRITRHKWEYSAVVIVIVIIIINIYSIYFLV
jgi:hypothetical protein